MPRHLTNHGNTWLEAEENRLYRRFKEGWSIGMLCVEHGRTVYAVITRLERMHLLINTGCGYAQPKHLVSYKKLATLEYNLERL